MSRNLVRNRALIEVPEDLTYFVHDDDRLVVNPEAGARCMLRPDEFRVLQALARAGQDRLAESIAETPENERVLAKLVLNWVVYFNGHKPKRAVPGDWPLNTAYYAITEGCNLRCPYCYASSERRLPGELVTAESMDLVTQIADMGAGSIVFTGGEPTLRKDLFQIAQHAVDCGLQAKIITNATTIRKPETAQRFAELFTRVTVSVDGATAETHDKTRGAGAFARTHKALRMLNDAGVRPQINHIMTSDHIDELEEFAKFMDGLDVMSIRLMNHDRLGRGTDNQYDFGWEDHLRVQGIVWGGSPAAAKLQEDGPRPLAPCGVKLNCGMGGNEIYINSLGDVYPCKLVTERSVRAGNVRDKPLAEIFAAPVLAGMRRSSVFGGDYHADCAKCYIKASCGGGCRAKHWAETGDLKRNSRHECRVLRHGVVSQLWLEAGFSRAELAAKHAEMTTPRLVADDRLHPVYEDWKTYTPPPRPDMKVREPVPIAIMRRSTDGVAAGK
jgi:radical SAM protein with 4Fe4S-binding SPASM domain